MTSPMLICCAAIGLLLESSSFAQALAPAKPAATGRSRTLNTTFPQQTRKLASPDVLARGKGLYSVNCSACHGSDLRGGDQGGPNLLRSLTALSDQHGELISPIIHGARQDKGMPAFHLSDADSTAVAEYIHSVLAMVGPQARPPGKTDITDKDILVGDVSAGENYFQTNCASCHSVTGDLKDLAARYKDPRALQNAWVAGGAVMRRGNLPAAGVPGKPSTVTVTFTNGEKLEGTLIRKDDFIVTLLLPDGERRSISLESSDPPKVEIHDPLDAHRELARNLNNDNMHNVTAYLAAIK
jgi:cytochrome c oxidase cbb3-type subunit III